MRYSVFFLAVFLVSISVVTGSPSSRSSTPNSNLPDLRERCGNSCVGFCGDGIVQSWLGEQCDDGLKNGGPLSNCTTECTWCNGEPPRCGDGHVDPEEECDNGAMNGAPGSSCDAHCHKVIIPNTTCQTCNPNPFLNQCTVTTSCIITPSQSLYCACRAGYRADNLSPTDPQQFRLNFPSQEYRVFVAPGIDCNTLCDSPFPGPDSCQEVPVQLTC